MIIIDTFHPVQGKKESKKLKKFLSKKTNTTFILDKNEKKSRNWIENYGMY